MAQRATKRQVNRLPPEQRIADIMRSAREVFTEKGYSESLISDIAERAGVVEGTIYRFFENKRDLLQRVAEAWYVEMMEASEPGFGAVQGEWNRIHYVVYSHLEALQRDPGLARLVFHELRPDPHYRSTRLFELNRAYTRRIAEIVREGAARGVFRADVSPSLVRDMVYGTIEHRTWAFLRNEGAFDLEATAREITNIVYGGLLPRAPGGAPRDEILARLDLLTERVDAVARQLGS
ncbi:MAG TPA: TetR/AcrR family transcriptional regulator [Paracoccus solventivorans]|uniref:TetR/AcrR family transcriptional regulator n=1 Tax=Paracoccus solventivorans TaxID=53463 RepID=A0A832PJE8_9RHOB|nr:TetR/AcrR family transcriptional regulator [Paracoccus solventivorans]HHW32648.1 TetR/AcrR family transcriptional regulator [Paracoccus solventivorans]HMM10211.1 TetR/AcrR family transcriptional regulator [Paracoccus solventivorans]